MSIDMHNLRSGKLSGCLSNENHDQMVAEGVCRI